MCDNFGSLGSQEATSGIYSNMKQRYAMVIWNLGESTKSLMGTGAKWISTLIMNMIHKKY